MTGSIIWLTGLPASGKSTLARRVRERLGDRLSCVVLDSDEVRVALGQDAYGASDRDAFYRVLARLAVLIARQGHVVLVPATAPRREHREFARAEAPTFVEVWVRTPREVCERRDVKGLYARARAGSAPTLPGVGTAYEPPTAPDVIADGGEDEHALTELIGQIDALASAWDH